MGLLANGLIAGAVGTELLNVATYLDMAIRARGASSLPQEDVQKLADRAGISLGAEETAENRKSALGALLGYATGGGIGVAYALARPAVRRLPAAVVVGLAAMALTDASSTALGTTDPRSWSAQDWLADLIPHLAYGVGVVATYNTLDSR